MLTSTIILNLSNTYGLQDDILVIERILKNLQSLPFTVARPNIRDLRQPHAHTDINFHLEVPCFSAIPWGHTNIMLVNPEQWSYAYDDYIHAFDALLFRDPVSMEQFRTELDKKGIASNHLYLVPWCSSWQKRDITPFNVANTNKQVDEFVCFLGGSTNKYEYVRKLLAVWRESDPALTIYTTRKDHAEGLKLSCTDVKNVTVIEQDLDKNRRIILSNYYRGHLICSQGEAFAYAAAHAEVCGAFAIMNRLPVFETMYRDLKGVAWLSNQYQASTTVRYSFAEPCSTVRDELDTAFTAFWESSDNNTRAVRQLYAENRFQDTCNTVLPILQVLYNTINMRKPAKGVVHCPPILTVENCPPISIITPTYNRKKLIDIAFHNMLATDYPHNKIEWIIIEDNEKTPHMAADKVIQFQVQAPLISMKYIPIEGRMSIGEKRNHAVEHAANDIILFMDDDDHYPSTSFRRRVAWLLKGTKRGQTGLATIACCTTLPLYDLNRGISAINVPPFDIPFCQRISEATLTFKKSAWVERRFPNVSISEGEHWIQGREEQVIEIPPQQIIVAFSHGSNQSSRRLSSEGPGAHPSCFWGFPKEYLIFIHGLVGVEVEEMKDQQVKSKKK